MSKKPPVVEKEQEVKAGGNQAVASGMKKLINMGSRSFQTSRGELAAGGSIELPEKEANSILDYIGVVDAAKYVAPGNVSADFAKQIEKMAADLQKAQEVILEKDAEIAALKKKLGE